MEIHVGALEVTVRFGAEEISVPDIFGGICKALRLQIDHFPAVLRDKGLCGERCQKFILRSRDVCEDGRKWGDIDPLISADDPDPDRLKIDRFFGEDQF